MKEAYLYKKLGNKTAQCQTCAHYCVLKNNEKGVCGVRENKDGKIYSLAYGRACAVGIDPVEKKPFFHFLPGTKSLSIATVGCNFSCQNCQNWSISQEPKILGHIRGKEIPPKEIIELARSRKLPSISYTYTEPTIFLEYALDIMELARKEKLKNLWVTNGFLSKESLEKVAPYLDAVNVDLKSLSDEFYQKYCSGRLQPVLDTIIRLKKKGIWIEITTLIIPTLNDSEKMLKEIAHFIKNRIGPNTPWHITQFCGEISWRLQRLPNTPVKTLKKAWEIGKKTGLKYVYTGNIAGLESEDTYCPKCNTKMIERLGYLITRYDKNGNCAKCGEPLNIIE